MHRHLSPTCEALRQNCPCARENVQVEEREQLDPYALKSLALIEELS